MEWIESLNRAIDYIEDNLLENLTCHEIANHVFISSEKDALFMSFANFEISLSL